MWLVLRIATSQWLEAMFPFAATLYGLDSRSSPQYVRIHDVKHDSPNEPQNTSAMRDNEDYIDLRPIFAQIWKARKTILAGIVIIVLVAVLVNEFLGKYWSEGRVKIINISPTAYRSFQHELSDVGRFRAYVLKEGISDRQSISFIEELLSLPSDQLDRYASIARPIGSKDDKGTVVLKGKDGEAELRPVFIGMDLKIPGPSSTAAQLRSRLFADYFADTFIYSDLRKWLESMASERAAAFPVKLEAMEIQRSIDEESMRLDALRALTKRFPESLRMGSSPLISVDVKNDKPSAPNSEGYVAGRHRVQGDGLARFLSPVAQMVAAESAIIDRKIDLLKLQREQKQSDLSYKFYKQAAAIGLTANSGREYFKQLTMLKDVFLRDISPSDADGIEVANEISYELEQRQFRYESGFNFLSGPSLPEGRNKKNPLLIVLGAGAGGAFFMVAATLLLSWWRKNAKFLAADTGPTANTN
jgi:hypothetical protein